MIQLKNKIRCFLKHAKFIAKIEKGNINKNLFTKKQLGDIYSGRAQIDGYTWHHNAQSGPNNMQLVPKSIHDAVKHVGEGALSEGR
ncbi:HNH endonuclease [Ursidibacter arcticus]